MQFDFTACDLRRSATPTEKTLWRFLKARQMLGLKFRRQHPMGPYIVDFVCLKKKIIIEVDGAVHKGRELYDQKRDAWLTAQGFVVMRITNDDITFRQMETLINLRDMLLKRIMR